MNEREPIKVIGDVIKAELELTDAQIVLDNQAYTIPSNPGLFVVLSYVSGKAIGTKSDFEHATNLEIQSVVMLYQIQIDVMSKDSSARTRKEEVIMALQSIAAQLAQDANNLQIASIPGDFMNASSLEETARLNRYTMTVNVTALKTKEKVAAYFSTFPAQFQETAAPAATEFEPAG